jgi:NADH-quinone oxidoreductase subunit C
MLNEELKQNILTIVPEANFDETGEWLNVTINSKDWLIVARHLREDVILQFDYLFCVTAVDWKTNLSMVYHLTSTLYRHTIVIKATIENRDEPEIESVWALWRTAEFHEREAYDLMGIKFLNHPDLRRLLLTDDWNGYPLRKDYEDPINMIKL